MATIQEVERFWNGSPLWSGEGTAAPGEPEYYREHAQVVVDDCFAGELDERTMPPEENRVGVLDLGCGPGFWTIELAQRGCRKIVAADLTERALELARKRCELHGVEAGFSQENAEALSFADGTFSHVNCQGVIHHTPHTEQCVAEIARVLKPGGSANISVYYRNVVLKAWPVLRFAGKALAWRGARLAGRGREDIYTRNDADDIVRRFDGAENPIGKCYTRRQFSQMLEPHFRVEETFLHFFPARTLSFRMPHWLHRRLDRHAGFMIYARLRKR